ncbi:MAG: DUF3127 domain-containing protein [Bacteroidaceae bacterium]|nr:DUF3127 domain-containing protein [Bacteroidaceae bacterium]
MELEGKISVVMPATSGVSQSTGNQWMSQEYVMAYYWFPNQTNPSFIVLRAFGEDRIKQFNLQPNDEVRVRYHIEAHEYNGRWFNEIRLDAVTFVGASASKNQQPANQPAQAAQTAAVDNQQANQPAEAQKAADGEQKDKNDDLPF